jgi:hypothetical protein
VKSECSVAGGIYPNGGLRLILGRSSSQICVERAKLGKVKDFRKRDTLFFMTK